MTKNDVIYGRPLMMPRSLSLLVQNLKDRGSTVTI